MDRDKDKGAEKAPRKQTEAEREAEAVAAIEDWGPVIMSCEVHVCRDARDGGYEGALIKARDRDVWIDTNWSELRAMSDKSVTDLPDDLVSHIDERVKCLFGADPGSFSAFRERTFDKARKALGHARTKAGIAVDRAWGRAASELTNTAHGRPLAKAVAKAKSALPGSGKKAQKKGEDAGE